LSAHERKFYKSDVKFVYLIAIILSESNHNTEEGYLGTPRLRPTQHSVFTPYGGLSTLIDNSTARHLPSSMEPDTLLQNSMGLKGLSMEGGIREQGGDRPGVETGRPGPTCQPSCLPWQMTAPWCHLPLPSHSPVRK